MQILSLVFSVRFLFWFIVGAGVTYWLLNRKGRDPMFGAILCGILAGFGGIFLMIWVWLWMYYFMDGAVIKRTYKVYNSRRWKIRW
jgi:biotin transporter BioY